MKSKAIVAVRTRAVLVGVLAGAVPVAQARANETRMEYDSANRLRTVERGSTRVRYLYDGLGQLVGEIVIDGGQVIRRDLVIDESGELPRVVGLVASDGREERYAYGPQGLARVHRAGQALDATVDHHGSVVGLVDGSGNRTARRSYDAWGRVRAAQGELPPLAYGGEHVGTSNFVWLRARHYAPEIGRFLQRDTFGGAPTLPQSFNRFVYAAGGNPLRDADPSGHVIPAVAIGAAVLVGLILGTTVAPLALVLGDAAGSAEVMPELRADAAAGRRGELSQTIEGWWVANSVVTEVGGGFGTFASARRYQVPNRQIVPELVIDARPSDVGGSMPTFPLPPAMRPLDGPTGAKQSRWNTCGYASCANVIALLDGDLGKAQGIYRRLLEDDPPPQLGREGEPWSGLSADDMMKKLRSYGVNATVVTDTALNAVIDVSRKEGGAVANIFPWNNHWHTMIGPSRISAETKLPSGTVVVVLDSLEKHPSPMAMPLDAWPTDARVYVRIDLGKP